MKRLAIVLITLGIIAGACKGSNFAGTNQDPSTIVEPDLVYLFTQSLQEMENNHAVVL